jgi:hypothetical protein
MTEKIDKLQKEFDRLATKGDLLYVAMACGLAQLGDEVEKQIKKSKTKLPNFNLEYDTWYSEAMQVVKQLIPDRLDDFVKQYKNDKRKGIDFLTYGISDYLLGLRTTRGIDVVADASAALPKMQIQVSILKSAQARFKSSLFDLKEVLQADLFDSEIDSAKELTKKGFLRGAGAIAGVILEKHLGHICENHGLKSRKKHPSISDFNQMLKDGQIIDTPKWRFIQHLGDIRNLCDHKKERDPTKDDLTELLEGVDKVIKTVY